LVYQSSKGIWRDQPFELKLGRFRGAFRNRGFVLRQTNESTSEQVPDFERSGHASRHRVWRFHNTSFPLWSKYAASSFLSKCKTEVCNRLSGWLGSCCRQAHSLSYPSSLGRKCQPERS